MHAVFDGAAREGVLEKGTSEKRHEEGDEQKHGQQGPEGANTMETRERPSLAASDTGLGGC